MSFEKMQKIQESVNTFNDSEFVSLAESSVIIKNLRNQSLWEVPYTEEEGILIYNATEATCVQEGELSPKEKVLDNSKKLREGIKAIFSEHKDQAIEYVKRAINELPYIEESDLEDSHSENFGYEPQELEQEGVIESVANIYNKFNSQWEEFQEAFGEFYDYGNLFSEDGIKEGKIADPIIVVEAYKKKCKKKKQVMESFDSMHKFISKLEEDFAPETATLILENLDLSNSKNILTNVTKALVKVKQQDKSINVVESTKSIINSYKEFVEPVSAVVYAEGGHGAENMQALPFVYNMQSGHANLKFLQYGNNKIFSTPMVEELEKEFNYIMSRAHHDLTAEEMNFVSALRTRITYMNRTRQYDDEVIVETIKEFNNYFGKKESDYRDPTKQLGWKGSAEMKLGNKTGIAERTPGVK